ncbi:MAG TPA: SLC13 family permease, partial [Candidatus Thermoplasmatota archaeon]|nr:SLC13 family permease [Candidatus Thermoplasmatota archaeon]
FVTEKIGPDLVALLVLVALTLTGILTPEEAISGFASTATLTVLAMFVLSAAVVRTGVVTMLANRLHKVAGQGEWKLILVLGIVGGLASAFMNNTAVVAILIPVVIALAVEIRRAPSRFLIPLSYAAQMGGVLTLIGTSTNILASEISARSGHRPLEMFEFTATGALILLVGLAYLLLIAPRLLPHRGKQEESFAPLFHATLLVRDATTAVRLSAASKDAELRLGGRVLSVRREGHLLQPAEAVLQPGDLVEVEGAPRALLQSEAGGRFLPLGHAGFQEGLPLRDGFTAVEIVVAPGSSYVGPVSGLARLALSDVYVLGIHRKERLVPRWMTPEVEAGDTLLVMLPRERLVEVRDSPDLILVQEVPTSEFRWNRVPHVLAIIVGVVGLAALDVFPIVVTALAGAALVVLTGILSMREFYRAVRWDVIFLLAGLVPLGIAIVKTGGADILAGMLTGVAGDLPPWALLAIVYVVTALMTEILSNNATVLLMVPVVVSSALSLGLNPTPFVLGVAYAASTSFMTPVGYQTNTMIYGPGDYRFGDFFRVGAPLNALLAIVVTASLSALYGLY